MSWISSDHTKTDLSLDSNEIELDFYDRIGIFHNFHQLFYASNDCKRNIESM